MWLSKRCILHHISVDQFLFGNTSDGKATARRQLDTLLDGLYEKEIRIITATVQAMLDEKANGKGDEE